MFSLSYTPAYDPYHAVFRHIALLKKAEGNCMTARSLRVADFFVCFPWTIKMVRAPREISGFIKRKNAIVKKYQPSDYDAMPNPRVVFERMEPMQLTALSAMVGANLVTYEKKTTSNTCLNTDQLSESLSTSIDAFIKEHDDLLDFLTSSLSQFGMFGEDGLFSRTGLGEYRYDVV